MSSIACTLCVLVFAVSLLCHNFVEGRRAKGTFKTIRSEEGEIIDCVDIYQQPAFDHPLLKNHKIQMKPTSRPSGMRSENHDPFWGGQVCPQGTIPIKRTASSNLMKKIMFNQSLDDPNLVHEWAIAYYPGTVYGAKAVINVWNPTVEAPVEGSISQIWVTSPSSSGINTVEAGWEVNEGYYQDNQTRFFLYWTSDGYKNTGCYDHDCPSFVQTRSDFTFGIVLKPVSTYIGQQYDVEVAIHQDKVTKNWWVSLQGIDLGYYPASLFTSLSDSATNIQWGGEIWNINPNGHHTSTQMGSGHFPSEGYAKASYFRHAAVLDDSNTYVDADLKPDTTTVTKPSCYDLQFGPPNATYGSYFYYGGPGFSDNCQ